MAGGNWPATTLKRNGYLKYYDYEVNKLKRYVPEGTDDISTILKDFISKKFKIEPKKIRDVWYGSL